MNELDYRLHNLIVKCNNEIWRLRGEINELEHKLAMLDEMDKSL